MNALFCQWLDSWVIRSAAARMPKPTGCDPKLEAAKALMDRDDFFAPQVPSPRLVFSTNNTFEFPSPIQTPFAHNNSVCGRFYRCGENWASNQTVILLHGWNDVINYKLRFPILARQLNRLGMNCVVLTLPYHFERCPRAPASVRNFISEDILRTVEATHQCIADICALTKWLMEQGNEQVSLWGVSLGAWLAGLTICHNEMFQSAVLVTPVARMDRMINETAFVEPVRYALKGSAVDMTQFNLDTHRPRLPRENILLVEAIHDRFVPPETVEDLWHAWGEPEIWRRHWGHVTIMASLGLMKSSAKWLSTRPCAVPVSAHQR